ARGSVGGDRRTGGARTVARIGVLSALTIPVVKGPGDRCDLSFTVEARALAGDVDGQRHGIAVGAGDDADVARSIVERSGLVRDGYVVGHHCRNAPGPGAAALHCIDDHVATLGREPFALI